MSDPKLQKNNYERLEFLGDRVLNLIVSRYLYEKYPDLSEGDLTKNMRFVSNDNLNQVIEELNVEFKTEFLTFKRKFSLETIDLCADDLEAYIGNFFLKHGSEKTLIYFDKILSQKIDVFDPNTDYISMLQEHAQKNLKIVPEYKCVRDEIIENNRHLFQVQVIICGNLQGEGSGNTKSEAKKQAAFKALKNYNLVS